MVLDLLYQLLFLCGIIKMRQWLQLINGKDEESGQVYFKVLSQHLAEETGKYGTYLHYSLTIQ
jgi:hypothetical protein